LILLLEIISYELEAAVVAQELYRYLMFQCSKCGAAAACTGTSDTCTDGACKCGAAAACTGTSDTCTAGEPPLQPQPNDNKLN